MSAQATTPLTKKNSWPPQHLSMGHTELERLLYTALELITGPVSMDAAARAFIELHVPKVSAARAEIRCQVLVHMHPEPGVYVPLADAAGSAGYQQ